MFGTVLKNTILLILIILILHFLINNLLVENKIVKKEEKNHFDDDDDDDKNVDMELPKPERNTGVDKMKELYDYVFDKDASKDLNTFCKFISEIALTAFEIAQSSTPASRFTISSISKKVNSLVS